MPLNIYEIAQISVNSVIILSTWHSERLIEIWVETDLWLIATANQYQSI